MVEYRDDVDETYHHVPACMYVYAGRITACVV